MNGSGISPGRPDSATGARILATLLRVLDRCGARYTPDAMCIDGGQGLTDGFEWVA